MIQNFSVWGATFAIILALAGCFGKEDDPLPGGVTSPVTSCYAFASSSFCVHGTDAAAVQAICAATPGAMLTAVHCPIGTLVGTCGVGLLNYSYYSSGGAPYDNTTAQSACAALGGGYTPGGGGAGADGTTSAYQRCDKRTGGSVCVSYTGTSWTSGVETACNGAGDVLAASCDLGAKVGKCAIPNTPGLDYVMFYYSTGGTPFNATTAQTSCTGYGGTFTP